MFGHDPELPGGFQDADLEMAEIGLISLTNPFSFSPMISNALAGISFSSPLEPRKRVRRRGNPVTLIVGIIARDAIVFGAESQTTSGDYKTLTTNKLHFVKFKNGLAMLAESGSVENASNVIDDFTKWAVDTYITSHESAVRVLQRALHRKWEGVVEQYSKITDDLVGTIWNNQLNCAFLLGTFFDNTPAIYTADLFNQEGTRVREHYSAKGIGSEFGAHILQEYTAPDMGVELAAVLAIFATELAVYQSKYCGGAVRVGVLRQIPKNLYAEGEPESYNVHGETIPVEQVKELSALIAEVTETSREHWRERVLKRLEKRSAKIMAKMLNPKHPLEDVPPL